MLIMIDSLGKTKVFWLILETLLSVKAKINNTGEYMVAEVSLDNSSLSLTPEIITNTLDSILEPASDTTSPVTTTDYFRHNVGRGFPSQRFHLTESRWGPFFEEGTEPHNITVRVGSTVMMDCRIGLLQGKTVTWSHHKEDSFHLLTVGRSTYSSDERITLSFRYPNNFRLQIIYVTRRDQGLYECQVATHPPKIKRVFLRVTAPEVTISDELHREVNERYYRVGSNLELICTARQLRGSTSPLLWKRDDKVLVNGISYNGSETMDAATSSLHIAPLEKEHSGNYTCAVGSLASATIAVHVLDGELPAAVHSGNSAPELPESAILLLGNILLALCQR